MGNTPQAAGLLGIYIDGDQPRCQTVAPIPFTNRSWAELVLRELGAPLTTNNINNYLRWMVSENFPATWWGSAGKNNPLNNGEGSGGGQGLGSYVDLNAAAYWAAELLRKPPYAAVKNALINDASSGEFSAAVIKSPWAESHYGVAEAGAGKYTVPGRTLNYLATIPVPAEVAADLSHGANISGTNGIGWTFANPQVFNPKLGPLPEFDPSNPSTTPINPDLLPVSGWGSSSSSGGGGYSSGGGSSGGSSGGGQGVICPVPGCPPIGCPPVSCPAP
jgi:hypothetical protein